jgi:hypothetical protein
MELDHFAEVPAQIAVNDCVLWFAPKKIGFSGEHTS